MIFTHHAFERYRQFHMLDNPSATDEDARRILERFGPTAIPTKAKTHFGDHIWRIEELGVELVARPGNGTVVCVTVLPPVRFRGLTPLQAEAVDESMRSAAARGEQIESERKHLRAQAPARGAKPVDADAERSRCRRLQALGEPAKIAQAEHLTLAAVLKTMRMQIAEDEAMVTVRKALRVALRYLRESRDAVAVDALEEVRQIDAGLASDEFIYAGGEP